MDDRSPEVFVVDDDSSVRKGLTRLIESAGHRVEAFPSALEFLERDLPSTPCCLVLDIHMPGLLGLDLQTELNSSNIEIPIVFITGQGDIPMSVRAMKAGAVDFLPKPVDENLLLEAVAEALKTAAAAMKRRVQQEAVRGKLDRLTMREREVLELVITGMLNKQIAAELGAAEKTIKIHRGRVMRKMEVASVADLVRTVAIVGIEAPGSS